MEKSIINYREFEAQKNEAKLNSVKPVEDLKVGDFLYLSECTMKNCANPVDVMYWAQYENSVIWNRLSKIEKIVNTTFEKFCKDDYEFGHGGCGSDVIEQRAYPDKPWLYTKEEMETFYTLVTLVIFEDGRYLFADAEGFDYVRYVLAPKNFTVMFDKEISERKRQIDERKAEEERERQEEIAKEKADAEEYAKPFLAVLDISKEPKRNVKEALNILCPGVKFNVRQKKFTYYGVTVYVTSEEIEAKAVRAVWDEFMRRVRYRTGEQECDDYGYHDIWKNAIPNCFGHEVEIYY